MAEGASTLAALEEQLSALSNTKADMRELRNHVAGLEDELEELSGSNATLRHELQARDACIDRNARRFEELNAQMFALEGVGQQADALRAELRTARDDCARWRAHSVAAEEQLAALGRSHELLLATLGSTRERLLRPHGLDEVPLAWQSQLHEELAAVLSSQARAAYSLVHSRSPHPHPQMPPPSVRSSPELFLPGSLRVEARFRWPPRIWQVVTLGSRALSHSPDRAVDAAFAALSLPSTDGGGGGDSGGDGGGESHPASVFGAGAAGAGAEWWRATAFELRVERGQLEALLEQRRREARTERSILCRELTDAERHWPAAASSLRRLLRPVLSDVKTLPEAARTQAVAARQDGASLAASDASARLAAAAAAAEATEARARTSEGALAEMQR